MSEFGKELIPRQSMVGLVQAHDRAKKLAAEGLMKLCEASTVMHEAFGQKDDVLGGQIWGYDLRVDPISRSSSTVFTKSADAIKNNAWSYLLHKTGVDVFLSARRREEAERQIERNESPDFTLENVLSLVQGMAGNIDGYFQEAVKEVYDWLRPYRGWDDKYKTNIDWEVGRKVIKEGIVELDQWAHRISHYYSRKLQDLDRVFHLLDGKGAPKYPGDLVTAIETAMRDKNTTTETPYFKVTWYKKGTMHFEFLREDLLSRFNAVAGGARLKSAA
jgi:hypothetical protein